MGQSKGVSEDNFINGVCTNICAGGGEPAREKYRETSKHEKPLPPHI